MVAYTEADIKKNVLNGTNESDTFTLTDVTKKTTVKANAGNDSINASASVADMAFYAGMGADAIETSQGNNTIYCGSGSTVVNINSNTKNVVIYPQNSKLTINFDDIPAITSDFFNSSTYETMTNAQFEQRFKKIKNDLKIIVSEDCSVTIKNYYKLDGIINVKTSDSGDLINIENLFYNYVMSEEKKYKITSTPGADLIKTHNLKDTIYAGNDDTIETYGGNDVIYAKNVSCDIKAGEGNDKLYLGNSDVLFDYDDNKMQGNDTIYFSGEDNEVGLGIDSSEIKELVKSKNNLILKDDKGNSITLANYFKSDENYAYVSGVELEYLFKLDITGKGTIKGTIFDEKITGSKYADKIYINTDDTVIAGKGNDKIYSEKEAENVVEFTVGDGKDTLYGYFKNLIFKDENGIEIDKNNLTFKQIGKDVIINYSEKDSVTLKNFIWDETWVYNLDSTMDNYQNTLEATSGIGNVKFYSFGPGENFINFDHDVDASTLVFTRSKYDLIISGFGDKKDKITIVDYYSKDNILPEVKFTMPSDLVGKYLSEYIMEYTKNTYSNGTNDYSLSNSPLSFVGSNLDDSITGTNNYSDNIKLGDGHDEYYDNGGDNRIWAGNGIDYIDVANGNNLIYGGNDNDVIVFRNGNSIIDGGAGDDGIYVREGNCTIYGGTGSDIITDRWAELSAHLIYGGAGDDYITMANGKDVIYAGNGNDYIDCEGDETKIYAEKGNDDIETTGIAVTIDGGAGNDTIRSSGDACDIYGGAGNDYIYSEGKEDWIYGGAGNDTIFANDDETRIEDTSGNDYYELRANLNKVYDKKGNDGYYVGNIIGAKTVFIVDNKGKDVLYMTTDEIDEFKFVFDVKINSKGKIVGKNDIDLKIVASGEDIQNWFDDATKRIEIENYFGNGCIERMDFSYDYYLTNTQLNAVLEEVATWLYTNTEYSSVSEFISSSADASLKNELIAIYENVNWQCEAI